MRTAAFFAFPPHIVKLEFWNNIVSGILDSNKRVCAAAMSAARTILPLWPLPDEQRSKLIIAIQTVIDSVSEQDTDRLKVDCCLQLYFIY